MLTLAEFIPYQKVYVPLPQSKYKLFNPVQLGFKASAATWPPQWRDGARLRLCFSFNGLTGCVQGPGASLFSGCWMLGSLGKENVKVLTQLLREAANETRSSTCLRSEPANSRGKPVILHQSLQVQKADFLSLCFTGSKMLLL